MLAEYNCRCNIVQIKRTRPVRPENTIEVSDEHIPSKIDIKNGTVDVIATDDTAITVGAGGSREEKIHPKNLS
mgnify:CR=1 FL=1